MWFFFLGFFFFDLTDPISGNAFPAMLNGKKGDGLNWFSTRVCDDQKYLSGSRLYMCIKNTQKFSSPNDEEVANSSKKHTQFKTRVHKHYPFSDQNGWNWYHISDQNSLKTIPFGAAHTYIDYIRDYPPQGAYASETNQWYGSRIELNVNVTKTALLIKLTHQEKK